MLISVLDVNVRGVVSAGPVGAADCKASPTLKTITATGIPTRKFVLTRRKRMVVPSNFTTKDGTSTTTNTAVCATSCSVTDRAKASTRGGRWKNMNKGKRSMMIASKKVRSKSLQSTAFLVGGVSRGGAGSSQGLGQGLGSGNHGRGISFNYDNRNNIMDFYNNNGNGDDGDDGDDNNSFTETFYEEENGQSSAATKITNSLLGLFLGPIVILLSCWFLWHNEGWAIKTHRSLEEALGAVRSIDMPTSSVNSSSSSSSTNSILNSSSMVTEYNEKLIHYTYQASIDKNGVQDYEFGLKRDNSISISRIVEIYQWVEHKSTSSSQRHQGSNITTTRKVTYNYHKQWTKEKVSSDHFRYQKGHENYGDLRFETKTFYADDVFLGPFQLSQIFINQMTERSDVPISDIKQIPIGGKKVASSVYFPIDGDDDGINTITTTRNSNTMIEPVVVSLDGEDKIMYKVKNTGELFSSKQQAQEKTNNVNLSPPNRVKRNTMKQRQPQIGDVCVTFTEVKCKTVSVVGKLKGNKIFSWPSKQGRGYDVALLKYGAHSAQNIILDAQKINSASTWFKRGGGLLANYIGFHMMTSIVSATTDITLNWVPLLGPMATSIVKLGVSIANGILASSLSMAIVSIAWLFYRPLIGIPLLLLSFWFFFTASQMGVYVDKHEKKRHSNNGFQ